MPEQTGNEEPILHIQWFYDRTDPEQVRYELRCLDDDPMKDELVVGVSSEEATERVARRVLIQKMFDRARELGVDESRLRFRV